MSNIKFKVSWLCCLMCILALGIVSCSKKNKLDPVDTTAPVISNVGVANRTTTGISVTWTTDELANSQVYYATSTAYGSPQTDNARITSHSVALTGLTAGTTYHYQVKSTDAYNNYATSTDSTFWTDMDSPPPPSGPTKLIYTDAGLGTDIATAIGWFDGGDGSPDGPPWKIDQTEVSPGATGDIATCLKLVYTDVAGGWGGIFFQFTSAQNVSASTKVTFYVKGGTGGEKFKIGIKSATEVKVNADTYLAGGVTTSWQKVTIPFTDFSGVDFSAITNCFVVAFEHAYTGQNATIYIDNIQYE